MKRFLRVLSLFLSTNAFAEFSADVEFSALYLQPGSSNLNYAIESASSYTKAFDIHPEYHFGFDIGLRGLWCGEGLGIQGNWTHFLSKDTTKEKVSSSHAIAPPFERGSDAPLYQKAKGRAHFNFDALNLSGAAVSYFDNCWKARFFAGVSGARIKESLKAEFSNAEDDLTVRTHSQFIGAGPQGGVHFTYGFFRGFQFTGKAALALLVGSFKSHHECNKQDLYIDKRIDVVPSFEGALGLAYFYDFCWCALKIEAGYDARVYFDALQSDSIDFKRRVCNFSLAGPYIKIDFTY